MRKNIKKVLLAVLSILVLGGCTGERPLEDRMNGQLARVSRDRAFQPDTYLNLCSYYTGHDIGRIQSDEISTLFNMEGHRFLMILNINGILNQADYQPTFLKTRPVVFRKEDTYTDSTDSICSYTVMLCDAGRHDYLIFICQKAVFTAVCDEYAAGQLAALMLRTARSLEVDIDKIRGLYSENAPVNYLGKKISLFENIPPENGMISEIIEENTGE